MMTNEIYEILDHYIPDVRCELNYETDYGLLIATVLSAQCTDVRVNKVTKVLFAKYNLVDLANVDQQIIADIIKSCGSYNKKSKFVKQIAYKLINDYQGIVPNNLQYLMTLPGVGKKTANVVLKNIYNVPCIPVDTHVSRVSKRLAFANEEDLPNIIEEKLMKIIPEDRWNKVGDQILLFGRYFCKSKNPACQNCLFKNRCTKKDNI